MIKGKTAVEAFGRAAHHYDRNALLQGRVSGRLLTLIEKQGVRANRILEVGCGTGDTTERLYTVFPYSKLTATDASNRMVEVCQKRFENVETVRVEKMDATALNPELRADLIVSSMTLQWLNNPQEIITQWQQNLSNVGQIWYATLAPYNFPQWQKVLEEMDLPQGQHVMPNLKGQVWIENITIDYQSARNFFKSLKNTGAYVPTEGYKPLPMVRMRQAINRLESQTQGKITWRIQYGVLYKTDCTPSLKA